jgi:Holliday junction DNA helicase RuvA
MIAKLKGLIEETGEASVVLDVGGVGYEVFCSSRTLGQLPGFGEAAELVIETHVREDHIHLYGFISREEKEWFARLQTVQGVGARVALAILSVLSPMELAQSIAAQDKTSVGRASGVGPKLAARIVSELKDKVPAFGTVESFPAAANGGAPAADSRLADAVSALVNLGYRPADAMSAVSRADKAAENELPLPDLIRLGLKELSA